MPSLVKDLTLYERNDMTLAVTVTDQESGQPLDISPSTGRQLELIIKDDSWNDDASDTVLGTATGEITVTDGPNGKAKVKIASNALQRSAGRFVKLDVLSSSGDRSTAWYSPQTPVVDL